MLRALDLWRRLSAAWGHLYSTFVHQVAVTSFVSTKSRTEPSGQQPLPEFASVEAAMGLALAKQFGKAGLLCSEEVPGWAEWALHHRRPFPGSLQNFVLRLQISNNAREL